MYTKVISLIIQNYMILRALFPPKSHLNKLDTKKFLSEGLPGIYMSFILPGFFVFFSVTLSSLYIYIMYQQDVGSIPTLHQFSDWSLLEIVSCVVLEELYYDYGALILSLKEYFSFVTIKKDHKLVTTGPYSLLIHPSYTGTALMSINLYLLYYQLCSNYAPIYLSSYWSDILLSLWLIAFQIIFAGVMHYKRITCEEEMMKRHFDKEWDSCNQNAMFYGKSLPLK
ncbi:2301_t:CDS:2 [Funneliformis caledonium]|uniref:Protein-S-isoprenylcysteine O-methyltransferase n=1 Tax=Funneliformis caledonium TaxID=1117310 RepID=A0A9N9GCI3_9GLOM|nr:2301_t:CDS:2 [Funneliformis caledonium]